MSFKPENFLGANLAYKNNPGKYLCPRKVEIGQELFYEIVNGVIVPVYVVEIEHIVATSERLRKEFNLSSPTIWVTIDSDSIVSVARTNDGEPINISPEELHDCEWANIYFTIDEIVGHHIRLSDKPKFNFDGIYPSLNEAMLYCGTRDKRQAKRAHKLVAKSRRRSTAFVNMTHERAGFEPGCPLVKTKKKIYVKRGNSHYCPTYDRLMRGHGYGGVNKKMN